MNTHHDKTQPAADPQIEQAMNRLVEQFGGDPASFDGQLIREMIATAGKLLRDGADTGELKLMNRAFKELRYALKVFRPYREARKITVFGSARTAEDHPDYIAASDFSKRMADAGWMVITGAGDGIMKAGHDGAGRASSFGASIRLPFETTANEIIANDPKLITFRYFFTRKLMLVSQGHAVALFPGGFGTHDENFEVLTLIQTGKAVIVPLVMCEPKGGSYWASWDQWVKQNLLANGMIDEEDLNLYYITDDADDAARHVLNFYRNYHSQRFVGDVLAIRIKRPVSAAQLEELNADFADLVAEGRIEQSGPLKGETDHLELNRLHFLFTKRNYGRLRLLIDRLNQYAGA